jgi:hypothetical protein
MWKEKSESGFTDVDRYFQSLWEFKTQNPNRRDIQKGVRQNDAVRREDD